MESKSLNVLITMTMLAVILLVWTRATNAALERVEDAYELRLEQVERWPLADSTNIVVRPCSRCDRVVLQVNAATRYSNGLRGADIGREELLRVKSTIRDRDNTFVYIFYRPENSSVTRIVLDADLSRADDEDTDNQ
jgi:hypothetical protein